MPCSPCNYHAQTIHEKIKLVGPWFSKEGTARGVPSAQVVMNLTVYWMLQRCHRCVVSLFLFHLLEATKGRGAGPQRWYLAKSCLVH